MNINDIIYGLNTEIIESSDEAYEAMSNDDNEILSYYLGRINGLAFCIELILRAEVNE